MVTLTNTNAFFSSSSGETYNASSAENNAQEIDITFFKSDNPQSGCNIASPAARTDKNIYGKYAISWGKIDTEFRKTRMTAAEFDAIDDQSVLEDIYDKGSPTHVPTNEPGTRFNENDGTFRVGNVIAFWNGAKHGLIKIASMSENGCQIELLVEN